MVQLFNSPLKLSGMLLMLSGIGIAIFTFAEFLFLGVSVFMLGVLMHLTANLLIKSSLRQVYKRALELTLVFFIICFCGMLLLDFVGWIKIVL